MSWKWLDFYKILVKETTKKITSQERRFINIQKASVETDVPLMKNVTTPLAKSVLVPLGLIAAVSEQMQPFKRKVLNQEQPHW